MWVSVRPNAETIIMCTVYFTKVNVFCLFHVNSYIYTVLFYVVSMDYFFPGWLPHGTNISKLFLIT